MKRYSKKALDKRKEERQGFPEFFQKHIEIAKTKYCEECGDKLRGDVSEIAHILDKSKYKSVSTSDDNILYLCSWKSNNNCHSIFDNSSEKVLQEMKIFKIAQQKVKELVEIATEKLNYKFYSKWQV